MQRISCITAALESRKASALLAFHPKHVYYLTGFFTNARPFWQISQTCAIVFPDNRVFLLLPKPWKSDYTPNTADPHIPKNVTVTEYSGGIPGFIAVIQSLLPCRPSLTALADLQWMSVPILKAFQKQMPDISLIDQHPVLEKARMVKNRYELEQLKRAISISDTGLTAAKNIISEGKTEWDIKLAIDSLMISIGSYGNGFNTKVISGANGSYAHHVPGNNVIEKGSSTIVDLSASTGPYESDSARTFLLKEPDNELKEIHAGICELLDSLPNILIPGMPLEYLDHHIRSYLSHLSPAAVQAGNIGHGIGLHAHEYPDINSACQETLVPNMTLAIEPALYMPGKWGIRIENVYLIQYSGGEKLNRLETNYGNL